MQDFGVALGLALVIEGVLYFAFPDAMRRMMVRALALPSIQVRAGALAMAVVGLAAIWLIKRGFH